MIVHRRHVLGLLAGGALTAAGARPASATSRMHDLIVAARDLPTVAQRIDAISRALIGTPYRGYTLIGGPQQDEQFVVRDDCFDCVTFCEAVLAAATARWPADYEAELRRIRYYQGRIGWPERNHYFSAWSENNIANGICRRIVLPGGTEIDKRLDWMSGLDTQRMSVVSVPRASLFAHRQRLASGDIIGFLSRRPGLDYFHTGFIVIDDDGDLWLRHASKSRGRVLDEPLARFLSINRVRGVTLLRAEEGRVEDVIA